MALYSASFQTSNENCAVELRKKKQANKKDKKYKERKSEKKILTKAVIKSIIINNNKINQIKKRKIIDLMIRNQVIFSGGIFRFSYASSLLFDRFFLS